MQGNGLQGNGLLQAGEAFDRGKPDLEFAGVVQW